MPQTGLPQNASRHTYYNKQTHHNHKQRPPPPPPPRLRRRAYPWPCTRLQLLGYNSNPHPTPYPLPPQARYRLPISKATAGNLVLVEGLDAVVAKTATVVPESFDSEDVYIFRPLRFQTLRWGGKGGVCVCVCVCVRAAGSECVCE